MKFKTFTLTPSQSASVLIIVGLLADAGVESWSQGRIDWNKFVPALLVGIVAYCRSLSPKNNGSAADPKAGTSTLSAAVSTDTSSEQQ